MKAVFLEVVFKNLLYTVATQFCLKIRKALAGNSAG